MTMTTTSMPTTSSPSGRSLFAKLRAAWARSAMIRKTEAELFRMSDHELSDIGIARGDIRRVARECAEG